MHFGKIVKNVAYTAGLSADEFAVMLGITEVALLNLYEQKDWLSGDIKSASIALEHDFGKYFNNGFRFDFTYLILRTDFSFRFKRPETSDVNNGWKAPPISFNDAFPKIFSKKYREWRYENFNFTVGINYPF